MAGFDFERELAWKRTGEAIAAIRARGGLVESVGLIRARKDLLRIVRDLGGSELVLTRRGWAVAALLSKDRWLALHRIIENQGDALVAHRCSATAKALDQLPGSPYPSRNEVRLSDAAVSVIERLTGSPRDMLLRRLDRLHGYPDLVGSERLEIEPHIRNLRLWRMRIVWRVDERVVTVVRIATTVPGAGAT